MCRLTAAGDAYCWGENLYGELGNGSTVNSSVPVLVHGDHNFTQLTVDDRDACALTTNFQTDYWGANDYGQLG